MTNNIFWEDHSLPVKLYDNDVPSLSALYHENSKVRGKTFYNLSASITRHEAREAHPALQTAMRNCKTYITRPRIPLEGAQLNSTLHDVVSQRKSEANLLSGRMDLTDLATMLAYSMGLRQRLVEKFEDSTDDNLVKPFSRAYPSAGAMFPVEAYLICRDVNGLGQGIYHYHPIAHALECLSLESVSFEDYIMLEPAQLEKVCAIVVLTAVFPRTMEKYLERGYRFCLLEAGHIGQNFYLTSAAVGTQIVAVGACRDQRVEALLGVDGVHESVVYTLALGGKPT